MKRVSVIGISVAAAALIMVGCGSSSSSGPSAPSEIKTPATIDLATVQSALIEVGNNGSVMVASSPSAKIKQAIDVQVAAVLGGSEYTSTSKRDCTISGSYTYTQSNSHDNTPEGGWTDTYSWSYDYDHCYDNTSTTVNGEAVNRVFYNGNYSYSYAGTYDTDANMTKQTWQGQDNYSWGYDNNETTTSRTYTRNNLYKYVWEADGDYTDAAGTPAWSYYDRSYGTNQRIDVDSSGNVIDGYRDVFNLTVNEAGAQDGSHRKIEKDGFRTEYDTNASGVESMSWNEYFKNFVMETYTSGSEENVTVNGTYGSNCLGGTVTFKTGPVVQSNQDDYFDGDGSHGSDVLPYAGVVTVSDSATVTFDANASNYSTVTIVAPDDNATYSRWSDIPSGSCSVLK